MKKLSLAVFAASLLVALTALAATLQEVSDDADALLADYEALDDAIANCPGGTCQEAAAIEAAFDAAEADRSQLHSDRATLDPCSNCGSVDAVIDDIDDLAASASSTLGGWDGEN